MGHNLRSKKNRLSQRSDFVRYHNITKDDMLNGTGLRVVLWVSGCGHRCVGCHNPITWNPNDGLIFDKSAQDEIFNELAKDYIDGITFSGGDPLFPDNRECVGEFIRLLKKKFPLKSIWLYTGYLWENINSINFIPLIDVIVDGKFEQNLKDNSLHWKGSSNQRVIDVKRSFKRAEVVLYK